MILEWGSVVGSMGKWGMHIPLELLFNDQLGPAVIQIAYGTYQSE